MFHRFYLKETYDRRDCDLLPPSAPQGAELFGHDTPAPEQARLYMRTPRVHRSAVCLLNGDMGLSAFSGTPPKNIIMFFSFGFSIRKPNKWVTPRKTRRPYGQKMPGLGFWA